mgnify:CR=1 FL=1
MGYQPDPRRRVKIPKWLDLAAQGPAIHEPILPMAERSEDGRTSPWNVSLFERVVVYVDVLDVRPEVVNARGRMTHANPHLWVTVEDGVDRTRWADVARADPITKKGFYRVAVKDLGPYMRVAYQVRGTVRFSIEFVGMQLVWLGPKILTNWELLHAGGDKDGEALARLADSGAGDAHHV